MICGTLTNLVHQCYRWALVIISACVSIVPIYLQHEVDIFPIVQSLNGHFSTTELMVIIRIESGKEREVEAVNIGPVISVAVEGDASWPELGHDSGLLMRVAVPLAGLLVGRPECEQEEEGEKVKKFEIHRSERRRIRRCGGQTISPRRLIFGASGMENR
nr:hypothetical protein Iba_chr14dCG5280 [Ipomoea batatas]